MTVQEFRSLVFLLVNGTSSLVYLGLVWSWHGSLLFGPSSPGALWAQVILFWIPVQVLTRLLAMVLVIIVQKIRGEGESPDLEDELDKTIDKKVSAIMFNIILLGLLAGLVTQALGLPPMFLFSAIGGALVLGALVGDFLMLRLYQRGL